MSTERPTEILNHLGAVSRDIGAFRSEANSRFDALEGRIGQVETRMDRFEAGMVAKLEAMNVKFDEFRSDVRRLGRRFDVISEDMTELRGDYHDMNKRVDALERKTGIPE